MVIGRAHWISGTLYHGSAPRSKTVQTLAPNDVVGGDQNRRWKEADYWAYSLQVDTNIMKVLLDVCWMFRGSIGLLTSLTYWPKNWTYVCVLHSQLVSAAFKWPNIFQMIYFLGLECLLLLYTVLVHYSIVYSVLYRVIICVPFVFFIVILTF